MASGLVLGGGGTRGSYHIGAYKALIELSKFPSVICGTSIGAINGAIIAQGDFEKLEKIWQNIEMEHILKLPAAVRKNKNIFDVNNLPEIVKEICKRKGIDTTPLKKLIIKYIDEDKLKESPVGFALVTYSVTDKKQVIKHKYQIPKGELADYLMASAAFPGLEAVRIGKTKFADGGFADNVPLSVITKYDVDDIFVVDVGGLGVVKDADVSGRNIITIRSQKPAVGIMDFGKTQIQNNIRYGYLDTKKALGKFVGDIYYIDTASYFKAREFLGKDIISCAEIAAQALEISNLQEYTVEELIHQIQIEFKKTKKTDNILEMIKKLSEREIVCALANAMQNKNFELLSNKGVQDILGKWYDAASAIVYFCK